MAFSVSFRRSAMMSRPTMVRAAPIMPRVVSSKAAPKDKEAKPAEAEKPKRARNAYNFYCAENYSKFKKDGDKLSDVAAKVAAAWKTMTDAQKKPYTDAAAKEKAEVDKVKIALQAEKKANAKPLTGYMRFCQAMRPGVVKNNPGKKITEIATVLGAEWKKLSDAEKMKYKAAYDADMAKWKAAHPEQ